MDTNVTGRRERKKRETSEAIQVAARRLFAAQGYIATTVQQIADEADVSERTFFRYFESKEDLLLPEVVTFFAAVAAVIRARPLDEAPLTSIFESIIEVTDRSGLAAMFYSGPAVDPVAAGRLLKVLVEWEEQLSDVLLDRLTRLAEGEPTPELALRASVLARAAASAVRASIRFVQAGNSATPAPTDARETLREAFAILAGGSSDP